MKLTEQQIKSISRPSFGISDPMEAIRETSHFKIIFSEESQEGTKIVESESSEQRLNKLEGRLVEGLENEQN